MSNNKKRKIGKVYVASPLGFSEAGRYYYNNILLSMLSELGLTIIDPWQLTPPSETDPIIKMPFGQEKKDKWHELNKIIGKRNADGIDEADIIIAVLDGVDVDSGTASEIGYGAGKGKAIEGYRGDFRLSADNIGSTVNLQVEHFIYSSGGSIVETLEDLKKRITNEYAIAQLVS